MHLSFDQHQLTFGALVIPQERQTIIAIGGAKFIGCASGLATDNLWFHLTDLWLELPCRHRALGTALLSHLEHKLVRLGIRNIYT